MVLLAMCSGIAFLALLAVQHFTQAQAPGPGAPPGGMPQRPAQGRMMMMQLLPLESSWAQVSFELGVTDGALPGVRKIYQEVWDKRKEVSKKAEAAGEDADALRSLRAELEKLKSDMNTKLKGVLSTKQMEDLAKWEKENQQRFSGRMPRAGGGTTGGAQTR